ncbi:MAG TPA: hypothetical protein VMV48_06030 [Gallionellaceae bacterium]|nr:hypothetical protein [Gallionellaceae bacterium]
MNSITTKKDSHHYPSEKTRWAYWMQAIEPTSEALNQAFPGYHPQWVRLSQRLTIGSENFINLRRALGLSRVQCAAYLRVSFSTIRRWEFGIVDIPFANFELLRLILESAPFKLSHPEWDGWFISDTGKLMSPDYGRVGFTPEQLNASTLTSAENALLTNEVLQLKAELNEAISENTRLRQLFLSQGVVDELAAMQDKLNNLMDSIGTAHVIPFPTVACEQPQEKVA